MRLLGDKTELQPFFDALMLVGRVSFPKAKGESH